MLRRWIALIQRGEHEIKRAAINKMAVIANVLLLNDLISIKFVLLLSFSSLFADKNVVDVVCG